MEQAYMDNIKKGIDAATDYGVANGLTRESAYSIAGRMAEAISQSMSTDMTNIFNNGQDVDTEANMRAAVNKIANDISFYGIDKNVAQNMAQIVANFMATAMVQYITQEIAQHMFMLGAPQQ